MNKYFLAGMIVITLLFINCPPPEGGGTPTPTPVSTGTPVAGNPTPTPVVTATPLPSQILIDDFSSYMMDNPPGGNWTSDCITSYGGAFGPPKKVIIGNCLGSNALNLMLDAFGDSGSNGSGYTGYVYAQKPFNAPAAGTVSFSYYHIGYNYFPDKDNSYNLDFWINAPADIANDTNPDWSNSDIAYVNPLPKCTVAIPAAGSYILTWRVKKTTTDAEDEIYIDDIIFNKQ